MKTLILHGNTRSNSNTEKLARLLAEELSAKGAQVKQVTLRDKDIRTCVGCDKCHDVLESFGCVINDDVQEIAKEILATDLIIFTSPIYTWMPTPPLKAVMDRMYAFTKNHLSEDIFNLLKKQKVAMIATSGDACKTNCDLFDESVRRLASFAKIPYIGYLAAQDPGDGNIAKQEVVNEARAFAEKCMSAFAD